MAQAIHLIRHGEVENPRGVIYGRLPGYHLSERGKRQAAAAAERLSDAELALVRSSPLERTKETADVIAATHGLEVVTDHRLIESETTLEGVSRTLAAFIRSPANWWSFRNPMRPSWGESFDAIRRRVLEAVWEAVAQADGKDVAIVSHQTPVLVARLALSRRRVPPWLAFTPCETGSVTTLVMDGDRLVSASYFKPAE